MAKADDTSSKIDWIWLREAKELAFAALGAEELAEERLIEWLAAEKLPWSCTSWKGHDAEEIAKAKQQLREAEITHIFPSAVYHEGDPKFWGVRRVRLQINWEQSTALEPVTGGAKARGVKVSRTHLLALLPRVPSRNEKVGPQTRRVLEALKKVYPPDGKVPDDVPVGVVRKQVNKLLAPDSKNRGLGDVSWDTVKRALGRD